MRQVVLEEPGKFRIQDAPRPQVSSGSALVAIRRVGVCGTDFHAFEGRQPYFTYPRILGHELSGEIVEAPADGGVRAGERCAIEPYLSCGACHACRQGKTNCCEELKVLGVHTDGGMRGLLAVPVERLQVSERLTLDQLVLVEPLGIGYHAVARSGLKAGEEVLVVGAGPIGTAVTQWTVASGGRVRVLETSAARRELAKRLGVEILEKPDSRLADVVFDATGSAAAMSESVSRVAHGGRLVFVGLVQDRVRLDDPLFHRREITLLSTRNSANEFPRVIRAIERGLVDTSFWITHRLSLAEVPARLPVMPKQPGLLKAVVEVNAQDA